MAIDEIRRALDLSPDGIVSIRLRSGVGNHSLTLAVMGRQLLTSETCTAVRKLFEAAMRKSNDVGTLVCCTAGKKRPHVS